MASCLILPDFFRCPRATNGWPERPAVERAFTGRLHREDSLVGLNFQDGLSDGAGYGERIAESADEEVLLCTGCECRADIDRCTAG